ncbi:hypothetical protein ACFQV2_16110 [Actinokineospora soli]|uniref:DUF4878 domain-containing protein n=1 Tax=Actinokineospora soli TaxID=1048753 RepID=A0ABW2TNL6_9PSEU
MDPGRGRRRRDRRRGHPDLRARRRRAPQQVAETVVDGIKSKNPQSVESVACDPTEIKEEFDPDDMPTEFDVKLGEVTESGDTATATITITVEGQSFDGKLKMKKKDGDWCADDFGM